MLLIFQTGWSVTHFIGKNTAFEVWPFRESSLLDSTMWFNALLQVIYSTSIGFVNLSTSPITVILLILFSILGSEFGL